MKGGSNMAARVNSTTKRKVEKTIKTVAKEKDSRISARIRKEVTRLNKIFVGKSENEISYLAGLIKRAAFMKCQLEDMEKDLNENGFTEMFSQSANAPPYERERPTARMYNSLNKNYQTLMKQLSDFVDRTNPSADDKDDGFDGYCDM